MEKDYNTTNKKRKDGYGWWSETILLRDMDERANRESEVQFYTRELQIQGGVLNRISSCQFSLMASTLISFSFFTSLVVLFAYLASPSDRGVYQFVHTWTHQQHSHTSTSFQKGDKDVNVVEVQIAAAKITRELKGGTDTEERWNKKSVKQDNIEYSHSSSG
mmetsp:Transcript_19070/g.21576  ORF Transcript_19070/g.21576 Transcript_19070/m.21576 type:complete len:162 (-) Transcript_19070:482-967(-)